VPDNLAYRFMITDLISRYPGRKSGATSVLTVSPGFMILKGKKNGGKKIFLPIIFLPALHRFMVDEPRLADGINRKKSAIEEKMPDILAKTF